MRLILILMVLASSMSGQIRVNDKEYFTMSASIDPVATFKDGPIDIVAEIEYVGPIYAKAGFEFFPALQPTYLDVHGGVGVNVMLDRFEKYRAYSGIRLGRIFRENKSRGELFGFEAGIDYNLSENYFVGLRLTYDYRNDGIVLGWDEYWRLNGSIRLGYKWN